MAGDATEQHCRDVREQHAERDTCHHQNDGVVLGRTRRCAICILSPISAGAT
jgi:hypothetical protein